MNEGGIKLWLKAGIFKPAGVKCRILYGLSKFATEIIRSESLLTVPGDIFVLLTWSEKAPFTSLRAVTKIEFLIPLYNKSLNFHLSLKSQPTRKSRKSDFWAQLGGVRPKGPYEKSNK